MGQWLDRVILQWKGWRFNSWQFMVTCLSVVGQDTEHLIASNVSHQCIEYDLKRQSDSLEGFSHISFVETWVVVWEAWLIWDAIYAQHIYWFNYECESSIMQNRLFWAICLVIVSFTHEKHTQSVALIYYCKFEKSLNLLW